VQHPDHRPLPELLAAASRTISLIAAKLSKECRWTAFTLLDLAANLALALLFYSLHTGKIQAAVLPTNVVGNAGKFVCPSAIRAVGVSGMA
jgi:hypothetical protein